MAVPDPTSLQHLSPEMIWKITRFLDYKSCARLSQTCRAMRTCIFDAYTWREDFINSGVPRRLMNELSMKNPARVYHRYHSLLKRIPYIEALDDFTANLIRYPNRALFALLEDDFGAFLSALEQAEGDGCIFGSANTWAMVVCIVGAQQCFASISAYGISSHSGLVNGVALSGNHPFFQQMAKSMPDRVDLKTYRYAVVSGNPALRRSLGAPNRLRLIDSRGQDLIAELMDCLAVWATRDELAEHLTLFGIEGARSKGYLKLQALQENQEEGSLHRLFQKPTLDNEALLKLSVQVGSFKDFVLAMDAHQSTVEGPLAAQTQMAFLMDALSFSHEAFVLKVIDEMWPKLCAMQEGMLTQDAFDNAIALLEVASLCHCNKVFARLWPKMVVNLNHSNAHRIEVMFCFSLAAGNFKALQAVANDAPAGCIASFSPGKLGFYAAKCGDPRSLLWLDRQCQEILEPMAHHIIETAVKYAKHAVLMYCALRYSEVFDASRSGLIEQCHDAHCKRILSSNSHELCLEDIRFQGQDEFELLP